MSSEPIHILLIEDCREEARLIQELLDDVEGFYFTTEVADCLATGLSCLAERHTDVVLLDLRMPGVDGMSVLAAALHEDPALPVVMMTAYGTISSAVQAIREGAFDYLAKPFEGAQLLVAVERAVRHRGLTLENRALREQVARQASFEGIIGSSRALVKLLEQVRKVAPTDANVLVWGESGTGKELIAQCIHTNSRRKARPFVPVDCAALPEGLLESELFGYDRGAFTGAVARREGLLAEANGGTVFLDEFTELSTQLQSKLLRALQERQIRRLGSTRLIDLDIRIVSATNIDPEGAVAAGTFREDFYYRLNVVPLHVPPLRDREGDIAILAQTFFAEFAEAHERSIPRVTPDVWGVLERYHWPGNVRELRNLVERLVVLDEDGSITLADLPDSIWPGERNGEVKPDQLPVAYDEARAEALQSFRRSYLKRLLEQNEGNITRAARAAGVSRRTLHRWLAASGDPAPDQAP